MIREPRPLIALRHTWTKADGYLTPATRMKKALAMGRACPATATAKEILHATTGRPRILSAEAVIVILYAHALSKQPMLITEIYKTALGFKPSQIRDLGLPRGTTIDYHLLTNAIAKLAKALSPPPPARPTKVNDADEATESDTLDPYDSAMLEPLVTDDTPLVDDSEDRLALFLSQILSASIPPNYALTSTISMDATEHETWGRIRAFTKDIGSEDGWPKEVDSRLQRTKDPDARDGHRSNHNNTPAGHYVGYTMSLAVNTPDVSGPAVPALIRAMTLAPAGSHPGNCAYPAVKALLASGATISEMIADRAYNTVNAETWIFPLWAEGIAPVSDLTSYQRSVHPGPTPELIWVDGSLFTSALPLGLRNLAEVTKSLGTKKRTALIARYNLREAYAWRPMGPPDAQGYQRYRGPIRKDSPNSPLRCINHRETTRLPNDRPTTNCVAGQPCGCSGTKIIPPDIYPRERQAYRYGTTAWFDAYHRRNQVESTNADLRTHVLSIDRGYTRVFGTAKNGLLMAFALAGCNAEVLRNWHRKRKLEDPWDEWLDESPPQPLQPVPPRRRKSRRKLDIRDLIAEKDRPTQ